MLIYFEDNGVVNLDDLSGAETFNYVTSTGRYIGTRVYLKSGAKMDLSISIQAFWRKISKTTPPPP